MVTCLKNDSSVAFQEINPYLLDIMSRESGHDDLILHEITESYEGANISRRNNKESPAAGVIGSVYEEAHNNAAIPQPAIFYLWGYDEDNNTIDIYNASVTRIELVMYKQTGNGYTKKTIKQLYGKN